MARDLGDRLTHVHMADGSGSAKDEHLVPGRGNQPCAELLELLAERGFAGHVVVEINTRRADDRDAREADLAEALAFTRLHLATRREPGFVVGRDGVPRVALSRKSAARWPRRTGQEAAVLRRSLLALSRSERVKRLASTMPVSSGIVARFVAGETPADAVGSPRRCPLPGCGSRSTTSARTPLDREQADDDGAGLPERARAGWSRRG